MISDFVKGKKKFGYPAEIQTGINLHRSIDRFTDEHPATKEARQVFRPFYRLYSGALVDVIYDHFLALDETEFTESSLYDFSRLVYREMEIQAQWMPAPFASLFPFMKKYNWLYHYRTVEGTGKSLGGVVRRALYLTESETAYRLFQEHYQLLKECYRLFWVSVKPFAREELDRLLAQTGSNP